MAEINTRIILRNDTAEAWKNSELKLKGGEAAVEVVNGKAKLKIATTDNQSFADAPYIGGAEANVFQIELTADETDIEAAIEEKGVDIPDKMVFADYAEKIKTIHTPMIVIYRGD